MRVQKEEYVKWFEHDYGSSCILKGLVNHRHSVLQLIC